jgi:hypothetical protein
MTILAKGLIAGNLEQSKVNNSQNTLVTSGFQK